MDTAFLDSFVAVVDEGSMAAAARVLNVTPAAVAQRVRALEDEIGTPLLTRTGRTVSPTEAGLAILERARAMTREVRDLRAVAAGDAVVGELRVGASSTGVSGLLPPVLAHLNAHYPEMKVHLGRGHSSDLYSGVLERRYNVAMITEPSFALPKACGWQRIRREPLVLLSPGGKRVSDPVAVLKSMPYIRYNQGQWGRANIGNYLREIGLRPEERFELDTLDAIAIMVDRGLGVSLIPDFAPPWPEGLDVVKTPVGGPEFDRGVGLVWLRASARLRLIRAFVEAFSDPHAIG